MTHDAEDLIHPEAFSIINAYADEFDMVQIPVLPLPTPLRDLVHGIYCDEFAEWQIKDMPARQFMGSFVPSNGVGTGFTREALEKLATAEHNLIFEPACLTEDYENGLRLHKLGCKQMFVPLSQTRRRASWPRANFSPAPRDPPSANARAGSSASGCKAGSATAGGEVWRRVYWFWRDRKGLFGNPLSLLSNFVFLYGATHVAGGAMRGRSLGTCKVSLHPWLLLATLAIQIVQTSVRMGCSARLYGLVRSRGPAARGLRQLDQFRRHVESCALLRARPHSP